MTGKDFLEDAAALVGKYHRSLRQDLEGIPEDEFWSRPVPGQVSPANLALHLTGNLRHFIGHHMGGTDYQRTRDREFVDEAWADKASVLGLWDRACAETRGVLLAFDEARLDDPAPVENFPGGTTTRAYLLWLLSHLAYHAGQVRTHYRIHLGENGPA